MRFLLDESSDARLIPDPKRHGHDVTAIAIDHPASLFDEEVLALAYAERRILITITSDRDFGELVFVRRQPHAGLILVRLGPFALLSTKIDRLDHVLTPYADELANGRFLVVTRGQVRVR